MLTGHFNTIMPWLSHRLFPKQAPEAEAFETNVKDAQLGWLRLSGMIREEPDSDTVVVLVHGLGGTVDSYYMVTAAHAAARANVSCLRVALRGADLRGEDYYHAALTDDLHAALASHRLASYRHIVLLGFSLGGHLVLRAVTEPCDARVRAAGAISAPLDLACSVQAIDAAGAYAYRRYLLSGLVETYERVANRRAVPIPPREARKVSTIRSWDDRIVAPRHGFAGADGYYREASVAPRLAKVEIPSLLVYANNDPMVPPDTVRPSLASASRAVDVRWTPSGGHVGFGGKVDFGMKAPLTVWDQSLAWLLSHRPADTAEPSVQKD